ncbi:unnamed protein product [Arabis nemorensis]|uniref:Uncharacterized protein n=1 Tax=Arabis nemorensis TaxID=586526 RepID=A0A565CML3_9BRAS|nr:unnamed protein product [Arabis nemorensis]
MVLTQKVHHLLHQKNLQRKTMCLLKMKLQEKTHNHLRVKMMMMMMAATGFSHDENTMVSPKVHLSKIPAEFKTRASPGLKFICCDLHDTI